MADVRLGSLLEVFDASIDARIAEAVDLKTPVGEAAGSRFDVAVRPAEAPVRLLGDLMRLDAGVTATISIAAGQVPSPFDPDTLLDPPPETLWVELELAATTSIAARATVAADAVRLTPALAAGGETTCRHLLAVGSHLQLRTALRRVVRGASWPDSSVRGVASGQAHQLACACRLDLGLGAKLGVRAELDVAPFESVSDRIQVRFDAVLRSALGLELLDDMALVAGRVDGLEPGHVRLRLARRRQRRLTFGATFALGVRYDLSSPFETLLDQAVGSPPWRRLRQALAELELLREVTGAVADGSWHTVAERLSAASAEVLADLVGVDDLWDWLADDAGADELFTAVRRLVESWDQLISDEGLRSLWDGLLGRVALGPGSPLRRALEAVARLDTDDLDAVLEEVLDPRWRHALALLEVLSGLTLEEVLEQSDEVRDGLSTASRLARDSLRWLDEIPEWLRERLERLAGRTGIAKAVDQLRHLTGVDELRQASHAAAARLATRLLERGVDRLGPEHVAELRRWAAELAEALDPNRLDGLDTAIREQLSRLDGEAGFSVALELDRLSRTTALLDAEVEPTLLARVARHLEAGSVSDLLEALFNATASDDEPSRFSIRDCVFTARRSTSSAVGVLLSLIGWSRDRVRRVSESWTRVVQQEDHTFERRTRHSGAVVVFHKDADRTSFEAGTWLTLRGRSVDHGRPDLGGALTTIAPEVRLTVTRRDTRATAAELLATEALLFDLGFLASFDPEAPSVTRDVPAGRPTRLGLTLRLGPGAVSSLLADLDDDLGWDVDVLNAARRWLDEELVDRRLAHSGVHIGRALAEIVASEPYLDHWREGRAVFEQRFHTGFTVSLRGQRVRLSPLARYPALVTVQTARRQAPGRLARVQSTIGADRTAPVTTAAAIAATRAFSSTLRSLSPVGWSSPLFVPWLLIARLSRIAPEELASIRGSATLRWQTDDGWQGPLTLRLEHGVPVHPPGAGLFPFAVET
jgi:hypothetical protein